MGLGPFALLSLFYVLVGVRVVYQLARNFRQTFDGNFTQEDRMLVSQAAFFVLLPIAVALHELGHAVAIWLYGGQVLGWGFLGHIYCKFIYAVTWALPIELDSELRGERAAVAWFKDQRGICSNICVLGDVH